MQHKHNMREEKQPTCIKLDASLWLYFMHGALQGPSTLACVMLPGREFRHNIETRTQSGVNTGVKNNWRKPCLCGFNVWTRFFLPAAGNLWAKGYNGRLLIITKKNTFFTIIWISKGPGIPRPISLFPTDTCCVLPFPPVSPRETEKTQTCE